MRRLTCHRRRYPRARHDVALPAATRKCLLPEHPSLRPADERAGETATVRAWGLDSVASEVWTPVAGSR